MDGTPEKISERIKVQISRDEMQAYVTVYPLPQTSREGEGEEQPHQNVTREDILAALERNKVTFGIIDAGINEALRPDRLGFPSLVAQGKPAVNGQDGYIEYKIPTVPKGYKERATEQDKVDYRQLGLIHNVRAGDLLAQRIAPTNGEPGTTVTGKTVPPKPGKPAVLIKGKNTTSNDSGDVILAVVDGHVSVVDNKIQVLPVYEVAGDVDYSIGNIDFVGNVLVKGNITAGFTVKAEGDIEVRGVIEAATVMAGGNLLVGNGIAGGDKAVIYAGGDVMARYIEAARVEARGSVIVRDGILQSHVRAGVAVRAEDGKGTIVGGVIQAEEEISAKIIGSSFATATSLEVGVNPMLREEFRQLHNKHQERKKALEQLTVNVQAYQNSGVSLDRLPEGRKMALLKLLESFRQTRDEVVDLAKRLQELEEKFTNLKQGRIKASGVVYPGVNMMIGQAMYSVNDPIKFAIFVCEDGEVHYRSLR